MHRFLLNGCNLKPYDRCVNMSFPAELRVFFCTQRNFDFVPCAVMSCPLRSLELNQTKDKLTSQRLGCVQRDTELSNLYLG